MNNRKILTIQQIIESEKKFIAKFSEETILNTWQVKKLQSI